MTAPGCLFGFIFIVVTFFLWFPPLFNWPDFFLFDLLFTVEGTNANETSTSQRRLVKADFDTLLNFSHVKKIFHVLFIASPATAALSSDESFHLKFIYFLLLLGKSRKMMTISRRAQWEHRRRSADPLYTWPPLSITEAPWTTASGPPLASSLTIWWRRFRRLQGDIASAWPPCSPCPVPLAPLFPRANRTTLTSVPTWSDNISQIPESVFILVTFQVHTVLNFEQLFRPTDY